MAKRSKKTPPETGEEEQTKKKSLFGFLRFKRKVKTPDIDPEKAPLSEELSDDLAADPVQDNAGSAKKKPRKKPAKKAAQGTKKAAAKKASPAKAAKKASTNTAKKTTAKKKPASAAKKANTEDKAVIKTADLSEETSEVKKKGRLFGFLKRRKKEPAKAVDVTAEKTVADDENESDVEAKKKGLFGFLNRKKKSDKEELTEPLEKKPDEENDVLAEMGIEAADADAAPEKPKKFGFLSRKLIIIILAACGVTGASGAAAIVFVGPMFLGGDHERLSCDIVYEREFELLGENRLVAYIRSDVLAPKERVKMVMRVTKYMAIQYPESNLFTVSLLDTNGPVERAKFRGQNIGAQVVYAPDPILTLATSDTWEVRYIDVTETHAGQFMGDRYQLSSTDIRLLDDETLTPSACYVPEEEPTEEELAEEEAGEEATEDGSAEEEAEVAEEGEMEDEPKEPGMIDNMLAMVGLGGGEEADETEMDEMADAATDFDIIEEKEEGFFAGLLHMVGLGGDDDQETEIDPINTFGTKVEYR